jgi:Arc/MetJ family transcription regulator
MVYADGMSRTNIEIDDDLIARVMRRYRVTTKRAAVDLALRRAAGEALTSEEFLELEGIGWEGDLEDLRRDRVGGR